MKPDSMHVEVDRLDEVAIIHPIGPITISGGDDVLKKAIEDVVQAGARRIALDLGEVTSLDSSGVGQLVGSSVFVSGRSGHLSLTRLPAKVQDVLTVTQLITVFDVTGSREEAVRLALSLPADVPFPRPEYRRLVEPDSIPAAGLYVDVAAPDSAILRSALVDSTEALVQKLLQEPESLFSLPPRRFEMLVADLLANEGAEILELTRPTRDGGRDILVLLPSSVGSLLCLVEVKRKRRDLPVGIGTVRQLYGTVTHEDASYGLVVTTSGFSSVARDFEKAHKFRIGLREYSDVVRWMRRYARDDETASERKRK